MPRTAKFNTPDLETTATADLIAKITERLVRRMGRPPDAVILTGSFARDEGSILHIDDRTWVLGDMEFLVVVPELADRDRLQPELDCDAEAITQELRDERIDCELEFRAVSETYFRNAKPQIFVHELKTNGRRVFGGSDPLRLLPDCIQPPRWDAWRMLHNRMIEQLAITPGQAYCDRRDLISAVYQSVKFQIDLATVWLIFAGEYQASYSRRAETLRYLARKAGDTAPRFLEEFADCVGSATAFKLHPDSEALGFSVADGCLDEVKAYVEHTRVLSKHWAREVWRWCAADLTGSTTDIGDTALQKAVFRAQPVIEKLRGWGKLMRLTTLPQGAQRLRRLLRLGHLGSPRYLVYSVAAQLYFSGISQLLASSSEDLETMLPIALPGEDTHSRVQICWRLFLRNHFA